MEEFKKWWASPFQADMSAGEWFLFFGLVLIIFGAWGFVFRHIRGEL